MVVVSESGALPFCAYINCSSVASHTVMLYLGWSPPNPTRPHYLSLYRIKEIQVGSWRERSSTKVFPAPRRRAGGPAIQRGEEETPSHLPLVPLLLGDGGRLGSIKRPARRGHVNMLGSLHPKQKK